MRAQENERMRGCDHEGMGGRGSHSNLFGFAFLNLMKFSNFRLNISISSKSFPSSKNLNFLDIMHCVSNSDNEPREIYKNWINSLYFALRKSVCDFVNHFNEF